MHRMVGEAARCVGFVGAGHMATALARGWIEANHFAPDQVFASDPSELANAAFVATTGARTLASNAQVTQSADLIVLAVKPQSMSAALAEIRPFLEPRHLVVSVAAGITLTQLSSALGATARIIRVMPNTPCLVGASASAYCPGAQATTGDCDLVDRLLQSVGLSFMVSEPLLDAVTGLSGSGPAYVYVIIEALSDGGVRMGLPRHVATQLAAQTVFGAAKMLLETGKHPGVLKDMVTSPGGTTIAGLHAMERGAVRAGIMDAVVAATTRARELGSA